MIEDRSELLAAIDEAWSKHSQPITVQIPAGADCYICQSANHVMAQIGFRMAIIELVDQLCATANK